MFVERFMRVGGGAYGWFAGAGVNQMQCVLNGLVKCILQLGQRLWTVNIGNIKNSKSKIIQLRATPLNIRKSTIFTTALQCLFSSTPR